MTGALRSAAGTETTLGPKAPALSVIIASVNGLPMIEECLTALGSQEGGVGAEVVVIDVSGEPTVSLIKDRFPWVRLTTVPDRQTIPQLRTAGLRCATGDIIAIVEDHCIAEPHWYERMIEAHRAHPECVAIGGAVENGSVRRLVDWAVFFCEYSTFMLPLTRGATGDIPGNNVSYKRRAFEGLRHSEETLTSGFWESTLHQELRERGERFFLEPSIVVFHKKHFGFWYFLCQRYHYSRYYAGRLLSDAGLPRRLLRGAVAAALPPLLLGRIARRVARKRRHLKELVLTAPLLIVFTAAWAVGEMVGAICGPGQSLREVE